MNEGRKVNIHAALEMFTSGQLLFLGSLAARLISLTLAAVVGSVWARPECLSTPKYAFVPECHCLPFFGLVHLRVTAMALVPGRAGRGNQGGVHQCSPGHQEAALDQHHA